VGQPAIFTALATAKRPGGVVNRAGSDATALHRRLQ
jgi:hypothetical protein